MKQIETTRSELRIVAGTLRGRKVVLDVHNGLRPTPQRVREALFSILGNAVPGRAFYDLFAGSGVVGLEAISRGSTESWLIEGDAKAVAAIEKYAKQWGVERQVHAVKGDVYRWAERWLPKPEPVTVFLSPPFPDLEPAKVAQFIAMVEAIRAKLPPDSVLVIQAEDNFPTSDIADIAAWDVRKYGRNLLMFFVTELANEHETEHETRP